MILLKNICMIDNDDNLIVAIVKGEHRASTSRVGKALNIDAPRTANESEIIEKQDFPVVVFLLLDIRLSL